MVLDRFTGTIDFSFFVCSYPWLRRLERHLLGLVWWYLLAVAVVKLFGTLLPFLILEKIIKPDGWEGFGWFAFSMLMPFLMLLLVLVGLVRLASRQGFDKALLFIAITAFPGLGSTNLSAFFLFFAYRIEYSTLSLIAWYLFDFTPILVAVWALKRGDSGGPIPKKGLAALLGAVCVSLTPLFAPNITGGSDFAIEVFGLTLIALSVYYGIAIVMAYLFWLGQPDIGSLPKSSSTLLCSDRWRNSC